VYPPAPTDNRTQRIVGYVVAFVVLSLFGTWCAAFVHYYSDKRPADVLREARVLVEQTERYRSTHGSTSCPTPADVLVGQEPDAGVKLVDPWGTPYVLHCFENDTFVTSAGPDQKTGTKDDVRVPGYEPPEAGKIEAR
jgi:hypothetical protein